MTRGRVPEELAGFVLHTGGESILVLSLPGGELDLSRLTPAQRAVVLEVLRGKSNAEIARGRGSSPRTVANLLAAAFRRLGVGSRSELVAKLSSKDMR